LESANVFVRPEQLPKRCPVARGLGKGVFFGGCASCLRRGSAPPRRSKSYWTPRVRAPAPRQQRSPHHCPELRMRSTSVTAGG
jgi:hypothetical protein